MKRLTLVLLAFALVAAAPASGSTPTAKLKAQLRAQKIKVAKLTGQLAKLKTDDTTTITGLNTKITALTGQVSAQAQGGLAAVLAGSPDDMWASVVALWTAFPKRPDSVFCGYDKDTTQFSFGADVTTNYRFTANPCTP